MDEYLFPVVLYSGHEYPGDLRYVKLVSKWINKYIEMLLPDNYFTAPDRWGNRLLQTEVPVHVVAASETGREMIADWCNNSWVLSWYEHEPHGHHHRLVIPSAEELKRMEEQHAG